MGLRALPTPSRASGSARERAADSTPFAPAQGLRRTDLHVSNSGNRTCARRTRQLRIRPSLRRPILHSRTPMPQPKNRPAASACCFLVPHSGTAVRRPREMTVLHSTRKPQGTSNQPGVSALNATSVPTRPCTGRPRPRRGGAEAFDRCAQWWRMARTTAVRRPGGARKQCACDACQRRPVPRARPRPRGRAALLRCIAGVNDALRSGDKCARGVRARFRSNRISSDERCRREHMTFDARPVNPSNTRR